LLARYRAKPPADVRDLNSFLKWRTDAEPFRTTNVAGNEHLVATAKPVGLMPSGPPAYVFDPWGNLVDWSADTGDDRQFGVKWPEDPGGKVLDRSAAARWPLGSARDGRP
jgi:hypothetical protein